MTTRPRPARSRALRACAPLLTLAACSASGDATDGPAAPPRVYAVVLGSAQDAGLPQVGCFASCCAAARRDPSLERLPSALLIVDARAGRRWLLDCTPRLEEQVAAARPHGAPPPGAGRPPLFDGVFLTHAHLGHYAGLLQLGREAYGAEGQRVWATERMERLLVGNDPWAFLIESGAVVLERLVPGRPVELADDLVLEAWTVPHRDELSDTVAFVVRGPERSLLYLPDIDKWERWDRRIEDVLADVDVALLDGTFYADGEVPGRSMADIPHPFIAESLARLGRMDPGGRAEVWFTHLNHTNPAARAGSDAARRIRAAGMGVAREGQVLEL